LIPRKNILYLLLLFGKCIPVLAQADNFRFINFGQKEGLADNFAYTAIQDKQGYMWFGTASGLYRYDGHVFKHFISTIDKPGRTISNILQTIYTAKNGTLWLGAINTLQWYNPKKNLFYAPNYENATIKKLCDSYILHFTEQDDFMWIATVNNYFYRFNNKDSSFKSYADLYPPNATKACIKVIIANNCIWAIHASGIYQFSLDDAFLGFFAFKENEISNATFDKENNSILLTTYSNGLVEFDLSLKKYNLSKQYNTILKKSNLFCATIDASGKVWLGSYPLFYLDKSSNNLQTFETKKESDYDFKTSKIANLFLDREKNLWICGYSGLTMMPWQNQQIKTIALKDNISKATVEPLSITTGNNNKGYFVANTNSSGLLYYDVEKGTTSTITNNFSTTIENKRIIATVPMPDGSIYASDDVLFFKLIQKQKKLVPFTLLDQNNKPIKNIGRNIFDGKGNVYMTSTNNGFYIWRANGKLFHYNRWDIDTSSSAHADNILSPCMVDKNGHIWFTGSEGIYEFIEAENKLIHRAQQLDKDISAIAAANYITQDNAGHFWISTRNNGLYELYFDNEKEFLKNYTQSSNIGLPSDYLLKIKKDNKENVLWISYNMGLLKFDPITKKVISIFKKQNGLAEDGGGYSFNITSDNKLVQLHYGKMNIIDLDSFTYNKTAPTLVFNSIKILDKERLYELDDKNIELNLSHNENFIQLEFAALMFNNSNQNSYAYMLEGVDKNWIYANNKNFATYAALPNGQYIFKVKAANNDGVWSKEIMLKINIKPIFYKSWWFITLGVLFFASLLYAYNRIRIRQVKKEEVLKANFQQQIATTEMKALRAQMNPHFIFNSLNSIQKYILQNDHFAASQYLTKFSRLIRLILDHSNQNNILLSSELDLLKLYIEMESLRFDNKFNYDIHVAENVNAETIEIPSMLIQPYVENAIWHGLLHKDTKGNLLVHFEKSNNDKLVVTIKDDGIGRTKAAELKSKQVLKKKSYGMQITEDRIDIINRTQLIQATCHIRDVKDKNGNPMGTEVVLIIPIKPLNN
jgi:ligand-binding sensor domain-containing protein/two-component sensor histidine kinase